MAKKKNETDKDLSALDLALAALSKQFGAGCVITGDRSKIPGIEYISSGSPGLDEILGGGYARGRMTEIAGPEASGKTTLALHAIAECQKMGEKAAFIDVEQTFDANYATNIGINTDEIIFSQPSSGEEALQILDVLARTGSVSLIVLDSVAALVPSAELEGSMLDNQMGLQARLMSKACRKLVAILNRTNTCVIMINQIRMKIGSYGNPETVAGGSALKFYSSQRLDIRRIGTIEYREEKIGIKTKIKIVKNKVASPFRSIELSVKFGYGLDVVNEISNLAIKKKIIDQKGAWIVFGDQKFQGQHSLDEYLQGNPEVLQSLVEQIRRGSGDDK